MAWLPVLFVCMMGSCDFMAGDYYWSANDCAKSMIAAAKELEANNATVSGVCIQIRLT